MKQSKWVQIIVITLLVVSLFSFAKPVRADSDVTPSPTPEPVALSMDANAKSGIPGSVVTYSLTIANNTAGDLTCAISVSTISGWTPAPASEQATAPVTANSMSSAIIIDVPIPSSATSGQNDKEVVSVNCGSAGTLTTNLVTTVSAPAVPGRPMMLVSSYYLNSGKIAAGNTFELAVVLQNNGTGRAYNVVITFDGGSGLFPQGTGGVRSTSGIDAGGTFTATQKFLGADEMAWTDVEVLKATVTYSDAAGTSYSDVFSLSLGVSASGSSTYYATATPVTSNHAQLVVTSYKTDVDLLQPGTTFDLSLDVQNMGASDATGVTMVLGGGATSGGSTSSTPQAGGVSGSNGELTNFAPLNSSNIVFLGDLKIGAKATLSQKLIVNTTTEPGVYTLKISFVYTNSKGAQIVDDQVITLLVYSLPQVQVDFYRDLGVIQAGMPNVLPLQVTNLGKKSTVLGTMKVTAAGAEISNGVSLVGALDPGGYYTLDANIIPDQAGPMDIDVVINYTDDFNQSRTVEQKINIDVQPAMEITPEGTDGNSTTGIKGGSVDLTQPETLWQKIARFFKGLFGLNSGSGVNQATPTESAPIQSYPLPGGKG
jgi:hypothetical protein